MVKDARLWIQRKEIMRVHLQENVIESIYVMKNVGPYSSQLVEEKGVEIPDDLINWYERALDDFYEAQQALRNYMIR